MALHENEQCPHRLNPAGGRRRQAKVPLAAPAGGADPQAVPGPHTSPAGRIPALDGVSPPTGQQKHVQLRQGAEVACPHLPSPKSKARDRTAMDIFKQLKIKIFSAATESESVEQTMILLGEASHVPRCHIHVAFDHSQGCWFYHSPGHPISVPDHPSREESFPNSDLE